MAKRTRFINSMLLALCVGTVALCAGLGHSFVMSSRLTGYAPIPLLAVMAAVVVVFIPGFFFRNLGALAAMLGAGFLAGGTLISVVTANLNDVQLSMSPLQPVLCVLVVAGAIVSLTELDVDWSDVGLDDFVR